MTAYSAGYYWVQQGSSATQYVTMGVIAGTYPCRIAKLEYFGGVQSEFRIQGFTGASMSGGSSLTPLPMRGGAPASTATVQNGCTMSGTAHALNVTCVGSVGSTGLLTYQIPGSTTYSFPFDYIIPTGGGVYADVLPGLVTNYYNFCINIYYEELRQSVSF